MAMTRAEYAELVEQVLKICRTEESRLRVAKITMKLRREGWGDDKD